MKDFDFFHNNFDLIRLFAALQVVFIHGHEHFGLGPGSWLVKSLQIFPGVPIFFVISGFLVSASWERSAPQGVGAYFKNRFFRIYPALWVCFFISLGSVFIIYKPSSSLVELGKWVIAQLTIGQIYNPDFLRGYGVGTLNGSLWTIPVEIQFYILLPLIYFVFNRKNWHPVLLGG
ncbi:MAG: acyltransferase [Anaerolineales bacterium]